MKNGTLKTDIWLQLLGASRGGLTHGQLAMRIGANEPSVRRAVKQMERAGEVEIASYNVGDGFLTTWRLV